MNANEYQQQAARTLIDDSAVPAFPSADLDNMLTFLHLGREIGETVDDWKKRVFHQTGEDTGPIAARLDLYHLAHEVTAMQDLTGREPSAYFYDYLRAHPTQIRYLWNLAGVLGESGEIAALLLDFIDGDNPLSTKALEKELGDLLWYIAALCSVAGLNLGDVMAANIAKLKIRFPDGWNTAASQARVDVVGAAL